jgi:transposase
MREMSVAEQRYLAVLADGYDVTAAAQQWGVTRQTLHSWIGRYEADGLAGAGGSVAPAAVVPASDVTAGGGGGRVGAATDRGRAEPAG